MLVRAVEGMVSGTPSSISRSMDTHQLQPIGSWVRLDILGDITIWHPWSHDAKREQCLRNINDGQHVRMRVGFSLFDHKTIYLVQSALSTSLIK